jgi:hypothetical protein
LKPPLPPPRVLVVAALGSRRRCFIDIEGLAAICSSGIGGALGGPLLVHRLQSAALILPLSLLLVLALHLALLAAAAAAAAVATARAI